MILLGTVGDDAEGGNTCDADDDEQVVVAAVMEVLTTVEETNGGAESEHRERMFSAKEVTEEFVAAQDKRGDVWGVGSVSELCGETAGV